MAITYPIPAAGFWDTLKIANMAPQLPVAGNVSRTGRGEITVSSIGAPLWTMDVSPSQKITTATKQAILRVLQQPGASFIATPIIGRTPRLDPLGTVAASSVKIGTLPTGDTTLGLAGLPPGYRIVVDDFIGWVVAGRYHLHQFAESGKADASGVLAALEVVPPIQNDVAVGQAVVLVAPEMKCILDPSAINEGAFSGAKLDGIQFTALQTLR